MVIALFRHGLTEENKRKAYLGWNDSPLCPEAMHLSTSKRYECYFSSDIQRCITTGGNLFPNREFIRLKNLREMNFGKWEGKTFSDLKDDPLYQSWITDHINHSPPEGESFQHFTSRIQVGWDEIADAVITQNLSSCAVITHGGVIRTLLSRFAPEQKPFWEWEVRHDRGFELVFEKEAFGRENRCTLLQEVPLTANALG
ncbi:histidine phosphatase family protein [Neobacillus pocheonensis]|uniref:histidine phosphatase family protein n=1 Tax=Neobacillus pocheonensis TaxID=363869 RepID=UPI003D2E6C32